MFMRKKSMRNVKEEEKRSAWKKTAQFTWRFPCWPIILIVLCWRLIVSVHEFHGIRGNAIYRAATRAWRVIIIIVHESRWNHQPSRTLRTVDRKEVTSLDSLVEVPSACPSPRICSNNLKFCNVSGQRRTAFLAKNMSSRTSPKRKQARFVRRCWSVHIKLAAELWRSPDDGTCWLVRRRRLDEKERNRMRQSVCLSAQEWFKLYHLELSFSDVSADSTACAECRDFIREWYLT